MVKICVYVVLSFIELTQEAAWASWVIVYGYQVCAANNNEALLDRFQDYGVVERYSPSGGNWIFIKSDPPPPHPLLSW